jgi:hypothetical protein
MYKFTVALCSLAVLATTAAFAQTKPTFDVATIKPAPPMDIAKVAAALQAGGKMPIGANVEFLPRGIPVPRSEVADELRLRREALPDHRT